MNALRIFLFLTLSLLCPSHSALAINLPDTDQLKQQLKEAKAVKSLSMQTELVQLLETTLNFLEKRDESVERSKYYQKIIDDFPRLSRDLRQQITVINNSKKAVHNNMTSAELDQEVLQISSQLIEESRKAQQEQDRGREISESLSQLPQQQTEARRAVMDSERRLQSASNTAIPQRQAKLAALQAENAANKAHVDELELAQLSANNRQELVRMRAEVHQRKVAKLDNYLQELRNQLNDQRQREAEIALARTEQLAENTSKLPLTISDQFRVNRNLSSELNQQAQRMDLVASQQRLTTNQIIHVRQSLATLREQSQWLSASNLLGEALRAQVARLPDMPQSQQIDNEMAKLRVQRLHYEDLLEEQETLVKSSSHQVDGHPFTSEQKRILDAQLKTQRELLNSLISGCDTLILEITKLKVANTQLQDALTDVKDATHRYLFWTANVNPMTMSYPLDVARGLSRLLSLDTLGQLGKAIAMMFTSRSTVMPIFGAVLLVSFSISSRRHFNAFLERSASKVGKVTQDRFRLTLRTVFWSIIVALPLPVLWGTLGYGLKNAWPFPIATAMGHGITATLPLLWVFMISAQFARANGLFIVHFRWPKVRVARAMRYYSLSIGLIIPLIMLLITFDKLEDRQFSATLERLCFMLICGALSIVTVSLKRAGIPLYLDKVGNGENMVNRMLWNLMITIPLLAALASAVGYLATAQALLARLETSLAIWFLLLVIYYIIRRWMLIQRRRLSFDRARQRRADILANRARSVEGKEQGTHNTDAIEFEEAVIDLDVISAQSLRLVRSILTLIALVSFIVLWSKIHSAFGFLENIRLWDVSTSVKGVESAQPITLGALLIAVLVFIITTQLVRNMPALLELALLQHLNLAPGTGYAITTLTKYLLLLIGGLLGFSLIGIEWSKLQWLVAALGVGLGFGLQEIFANFISGLIILFEKPIRIGDTVTIRDLTGSITRINTRATTITDWDRKEIIVPNKAFITEQFVNWSLSDSVTRVVLTIPAPAKVSSEQVTTILKEAAERCKYVLNTPLPEVFLVDLQQGIQLFELRVHAAEMGHRMPLRHQLHQLILSGFEQYGIEMPFPPFQIRMEVLGKYTPSNGDTIATQTLKSGGL